MMSVHRGTRTWVYILCVIILCNLVSNLYVLLSLLWPLQVEPGAYCAAWGVTIEGVCLCLDTNYLVNYFIGVPIVTLHSCYLWHVVYGILHYVVSIYIICYVLMNCVLSLIVGPCGTSGTCKDRCSFPFLILMCIIDLIAMLPISRCLNTFNWILNANNSILVFCNLF